MGGLGSYRCYGVLRSKRWIFSYIHGAYSIARSTNSAEDVCQYLLEVETKRMGLQENKKNCKNVAGLIMKKKNK